MTTSRKAVLLVGFDPALLDFNSPELAPMGLTTEKVLGGLKAEIARLGELGYDAESLLIDLGDTAEAVVRRKLGEKAYDGILIGAGVRANPKFVMLFEKLINVVHELAPRARICFNTRPADSVEAVQRWV